MSEVINNSRVRVDQFKSVVRDIHNGVSVDESKNKLKELMSGLPHGEVVIAEQELIEEGIPEEEIIQFCDLHSAALKGVLDEEPQNKIPPGHPVHTFKMENNFVNRRVEKYSEIIRVLKEKEAEADASKELLEIKGILNDLTDLEKHYVRKENLLFPFLEKNNITGPPTVMWAKDDEVRSFIKSSIQAVKEITEIDTEKLRMLSETLFNTLTNSVTEMIYKEEKILFPMTLDTLTENDWYEIYKQSDEIGYCLYDPKDKWEPESIDTTEVQQADISNGKVKLSTGVFSLSELEVLFKSLPVDLTFVDKDDKVKFFSEGPDRIFPRSRAIIGRSVQNCHPPSSVHIVEKILNDFKSGARDQATFWINFNNMFVHIAYYAMRGENNEYLGTLEVTQNVGPYRELEGERRILNYDN